MSLSAATVVAWISIMAISLDLLLSSNFQGAYGSELTANEVYTTVDPYTNCTIVVTAPGNNSYIQRDVPYKDTMLVLSCPGFDDRSAIWIRPDGSVLCSSRKCPVNLDGRLTNGDSGDYLCRSSVANETVYHVIHINVLAPPHLVSDNLMDCYGEYRNKCTVGFNFYFPTYSPTYTLTVAFDGNRPFHVQWYFNGSKFDCSTMQEVCMRITTKPTSQTITFRSFNLKDATKIAGSYSAVVSNPYGTNESLYLLEYSCDPSGIPLPVPNEKIQVLNLVEGSKLNTSCGVMMSSSPLMYACFSTVNDLSNISLTMSNCAMCNGVDIGGECMIQVNSTLSNITVSRLKSGSCPTIQRMNFLKNNVSLSDNGTRVICAYSKINSVVPYQTIVLSVSPLPSNNHGSSLSLVLSLVFCLLFIIVAISVIIATVIYMVSRKRRCSQEDTVSAVTIEEVPRFTQEGSSNVNRPLLQAYAYDSISQYGTMSVAPQVFDQEFEGPTSNV